MELEFIESGHVVVATFSCPGEPKNLENGGFGWFDRSNHLEWRCGWQLSVECSITVPSPDYGYWLPRVETNDFAFAEGEFVNRPNRCWDSGGLVLENRSLTARFPVPDCITKQRKSFGFTWGQPIRLDGQLFHCALRLLTHGPKDGRYLQIREATAEYAGGLDFMSSGDKALSRVYDSEKEHGKGRLERVEAMCRERRIGTLGDAELLRELSLKGKNIMHLGTWLEADPRLREFDEYVRAHPSPESG